MLRDLGTEQVSSYPAPSTWSSGAIETAVLVPGWSFVAEKPQVLDSQCSQKSLFQA